MKQDENKKWRKDLDAMRRKATMISKISGFGDTGKINFDDFMNLTNDDRMKEYNKLSKLSEKISDVWFNFIKKKIEKDTIYTVLHNKRGNDWVTTGLRIKTNSLIIIRKDFKYDDEDIKNVDFDNYGFEYFTVKFKYNYGYIDFTKPSISVNNYSRVSKGLDTMSNNAFLKYFNGSAEFKAIRNEENVDNLMYKDMTNSILKEYNTDVLNKMKIVNCTYEVNQYRNYNNNIVKIVNYKGKVLFNIEIHNDVSKLSRKITSRADVNINTKISLNRNGFYTNIAVSDDIEDIGKVVNLLVKQDKEFTDTCDKLGVNYED